MEEPKQYLWPVSFGIKGSGAATVIAATFEEAEEKARARNFAHDPEITDWDINADPNRDGDLSV